MQGKFNIKKWGKGRILRELKKRGISEYNINVGMKEILDSDYEEKFRELLEKKLEEFSHLTKYDQKKKLLRYFSYKGWETEKVFDALRKI